MPAFDRTEICNKKKSLKLEFGFYSRDISSGRTPQKTTLPTDLLENPVVLNTSVFARSHTLPRRRVYGPHCLATAVFSSSAVVMCLQRRSCHTTFESSALMFLVRRFILIF
jgi:hypothetical protein